MIGNTRYITVMSIRSLHLIQGDAHPDDGILSSNCFHLNTALLVGKEVLSESGESVRCSRINHAWGISVESS